MIVIHHNHPIAGRFKTLEKPWQHATGKVHERLRQHQYRRISRQSQTGSKSMPVRTFREFEHRIFAPVSARTRNPMLWYVSAYSGPGLPSPRISHVEFGFSLVITLPVRNLMTTSFTGRRLFFLLALLHDFGFCGPGSSFAFCGRSSARDRSALLP